MAGKRLRLETQKAPHSIFFEWELLQSAAGVVCKLLTVHHQMLLFFGCLDENLAFVPHVSFVIIIGMVKKVSFAGFLASGDLRYGRRIMGTTGTGSALRMSISWIWHLLMVSWLHGLVASF